VLPSVALSGAMVMMAILIDIRVIANRQAMWVLMWIKPLGA
jgi:hypothetical protein